jgi:hypothetical protein
MFPSIQSKISDHLKTAEERLEAKGYAVVRLVRVSQRLGGGKVFGLQIYGETFHQLRMAHAIVGEGYKLLLNAEGQEILIQ